MKTGLVNGCYSIKSNDKLIYYNQQGQIHREDGPALIWYYNTGSIAYEVWYINGVWHREDGPASIDYNEDGSIQYEGWYINGVRHREDGPAYIDYYNDGSICLEEWYWCGMYHRHDYTLPTYNGDGTCSYYWYGVKCTQKQLLNKKFRDRIQLEQLG